METWFPAAKVAFIAQQPVEKRVPLVACPPVPVSNTLENTGGQAARGTRMLSISAIQRPVNVVHPNTSASSEIPQEIA